MNYFKDRIVLRGHHDHERMVVGFTTTCAISPSFKLDVTIIRENNFSSCVNVKKKSHLDLHHLYSSMNNTIQLVGLWCLTALRMVVGFTTTCAISAYHH
jgi:hypothetical protein